MKPTALLLVVALFLLSCGGRSRMAEPTVITSTAPVQKPGDAANSAANSLKEVVERKTRQAADMLNTAVESPGTVEAQWAAVFICRLGLRSSKENVYASLMNGALSENLLLKALSWRCLANETEGKLPEVSAQDDPVVLLFAAISRMQRGSPVGELAWILNPGELLAEVSVVPAGVVPDLLHVYDNGVLAIALDYISERRLGRFIVEDGIQIGIAQKKLSRLLGAFRVEPVETTADAGGQSLPSALTRTLESDFMAHDLASLHNLCLTSEIASIRKGALRTLGARIQRPSEKDLEVVAVAMEAEDELVGLEAARVYLLLLASATEEDS